MAIIVVCISFLAISWRDCLLHLLGEEVRVSRGLVVQMLLVVFSENKQSPALAFGRSLRILVVSLY